MCDKNMTFEECELSILRNAVDHIENKQGKKKLSDPEIKKIIEIVENFLKSTKRMCYGGTAINNLLPKNDQFYNKDVELPDYDFFSPNPVQDAKNLANIYYKEGYEEVEAKAGMHAGTFKVFVNFIPVADITYLVPEIYNKLFKTAPKVDGIYYCDATFLRMAMYLELSRPDGDISRWEKVLKRLSLLNKHYPMRGKNCDMETIQRLFQYGSKTELKGGKKKKKKSEVDLEDEDLFLKTTEEKIFHNLRETLINQGCVFFGSYANRMYLKNLKHLRRKKIPRVPDFDVLSEESDKCSRIVKERLESIGIKNISIVNHEKIGEIIPKHCEIRVAKETIAFIYEPLECHSYNNVNIDGRSIKIASLDTMLSLYLAFLYSNRPYYDENRILCMSEFLFRVQQKNRLSQHGILKRFSSDCYGHQHTREAIRSEKTKKFHELRNKPKGKDWDWWFLKFRPGEKKTKKSTKRTKKKTNKKNRRKTKNKKKRNKKKKTRKRRKKSRRRRRKKFSFF